jgi:hypothetical protein
MIWSFMYHKGPAHYFGHVETDGDAMDETAQGIALEIATRWCETERARPPAQVKPFILATEAILAKPKPGTEPERASAVASTTSLGNAIKSALGVR